MMRAFAGLLLVFALLGGGASAQEGIAIQLRLTSAMEDKVDYYLSRQGGAPSFAGSIRPGAAVEIESRKGQVYLFAVKRVPFQKYTVRGERFQHLTLAPKGQQRPPRVAAEYQGSSDTLQPPESVDEPAAPRQSAGPANADGLAWQYSRFTDDARQGAPTAQLVLGIPETDAVQFYATCSTGAGSAVPRATISYDVAQLAARAPVKVQFAAPGLDRSIDGIVVKDASGEGLQGALLQIPPDDPLWRTLSRLGGVSYSIGGKAVLAMPLTGLAGPLASFLGDCRSFAKGAPKVAKSASPPAAAPGAATSLFQDEPAEEAAAAVSGGGAAAANDSCKTLRRARAKAGGKPVAVTFVNRTDEHRVLMMIGDDGLPIEFAHLEGGQSFKADTSTTEPWMMTDGPGNCIEMMVPSKSAVFQITRASPGFGPEGD